MKRKTRRKIRTFRKRARMPIAYAVFLGASLALFLIALRSCPGARSEATADTGVRIVTEEGR